MINNIERERRKGERKNEIEMKCNALLYIIL